MPSTLISPPTLRLGLRVANKTTSAGQMKTATGVPNVYRRGCFVGMGIQQQNPKLGNDENSPDIFIPDYSEKSMTGYADDIHYSFGVEHRSVINILQPTEAETDG